ncbi:MAG: hypothetical protein AABW81_03160 [Nanoarchaeota archaeon]
MSGKIYDLFIGGARFKREFKHQLRLFITFTLGFTIAFTWRQTIFDASSNFMRFITHIKDSTTLSLVSSLFVTVVSLLLIYLSTQLLKEEY